MSTESAAASSSGTTTTTSSSNDGSSNYIYGWLSRGETYILKINYGRRRRMQEEEAGGGGEGAPCNGRRRRRQPPMLIIRTRVLGDAPVFQWRPPTTWTASELDFITEASPTLTTAQHCSVIRVRSMHYRRPIDDPEGHILQPLRYLWENSSFIASAKDDAQGFEYASRRMIEMATSPEATVDFAILIDLFHTRTVGVEVCRYDPKWTATVTSERINDGCVICLEELQCCCQGDGDGVVHDPHEGNPRTIVKLLPCSHVFHWLCLERWLDASSIATTCPLCRRQLW